MEVPRDSGLLQTQGISAGLMDKLKPTGCKGAGL
jgi:hypothetical protein